MDLAKDLTSRMTRELIARLSPDEQAAVEAATGELGMKPDPVKLGWLKMRTKESWSKQRYASTGPRAREKLRAMLAAQDAARSDR